MLRPAIALVVAGACVAPRPDAARDAGVDAETDASIPGDGPFMERRAATAVVVGPSRVTWSQGTEACPLESGSDCPDPAPSISAAELSSGVPASLISTRNGVRQIAGDETELFYVHSDAPDESVVLRLRPGTGPVPISLPGRDIIGPAADATHVYWSEAGVNGAVIRRATRSGDGSDAITLGGGAFRPVTMHVTESFVWWFTCDVSCVTYRVPIAGGPVEIAAADSWIVATDRRAAYLGQYRNGTSYESRLFALHDDGTTTTVADPIPWQLYPRRVVIDGADLYWSTETAIYRVPLTGGAPMHVVDLPWTRDDRVFGLTPTTVLFDFTRNGYRTVAR